jgi:hypothetical protein
MAASSTDKFRKLSRRWVGQIGAGGVSDDTTTTVPLSSTTNLPTDTGITVVIDRVDANGTATPSLEETVTGVVSGSNLIDCIRGVEGTAQAHNAGAVVEVLFTAAGWNDFIDGFLADHLGDGTHGNLDASTITTNRVSGVASANLDFYVSGGGKFRRPTIVEIPVGDSLSSLSTGDGKAFFRVPAELNGMNLTGVAAAVYTAGTTNTLDVQIRNKTQTADMLSTKITIDSTETDSSTAATPAVIDTGNDDVATGDMIAIDIDAVHTTPAKGLVVEMRFELP